MFPAILLTKLYSCCNYLHQLEASQNIICFINYENNQGFAYTNTENYVHVLEVPLALNKLNKPKSQISIRLLFFRKNEYFSHNRNEFLATLALYPKHNSLFVHPYLPLGAENSVEPFYLTSWSAELRIQFSLTGEHELAILNYGMSPLELKELTHHKDKLSTCLNNPDYSSLKLKLFTPAQENFASTQTINKSMLAIEKAQDYMCKGEAYVLNYSERIFDILPISEFKLSIFFLRWLENLSRYGIFLQTINFTIQSFSPERFVAFTDSHILAEPIKGTLKVANPGKVTSSEVEYLWREAKEINEQCMIVDLLRNDLNVLCTPGTVQVHQPFYQRLATNLLQMQSFISGKLNPEVNLASIFSSLLPAGSISGTPKKRVCEIIQELEATDRGFYTGVFGIGSETYFESIILIRSIFQSKLGVYTGIGAGITTLSKPKQEAEELLVKLFSFLQRN